VSSGDGTKASPAGRLPGPQRRRQLLETAVLIVREEGADRLTLGHLAARAGVSKPVAYDHFGSRSGLLIELYRWIDVERVDAFRNAMALGERTADECVDALAKAYIDCAADKSGEFRAVGAALAGSEQKAAVYQELLEHCVGMFVDVLRPHSALPQAELERRCIGLVGAGEALSAAQGRGTLSEADAVATFAAHVRGAVASSPA
jgi:AcrR family transcriptional regulator